MGWREGEREEPALLVCHAIFILLQGIHQIQDNQKRKHYLVLDIIRLHTTDCCMGKILPHLRCFLPLGESSPSVAFLVSS